MYPGNYDFWLESSQLMQKLMADKNALSSFAGFNTENLAQSVQLKFGEIKNFPPDVMIEGYVNEQV